MATPEVTGCPRKDCGRSEPCGAPYADAATTCQPISARPGALSGPVGTTPPQRELFAPVDQWVSPPPDSEILGAGGQLLHQDGPDDAHPRVECDIEKCGWEPLKVSHLYGTGKTTLLPTLPIPEEVDFHKMLADDDTHGWAIQTQLKAQLGRPYLATQLASMLPPDVSARLVLRIEELLGPELEKRLAEHIAQLQADVNQVTTDTLGRLAAEADAKRRELTSERFSGSRLS